MNKASLHIIIHFFHCLKENQEMTQILAYTHDVHVCHWLYGSVTE